MHWVQVASDEVLGVSTKVELGNHPNAWKADTRAVDEIEEAPGHNLVARRRSALVITLTDESAIAAAAMIGESRTPNSG